MEDEETLNSKSFKGLMREVQNLISEVQKRPALWSKYDYHYNNRAYTEAEWLAIATILNKEKNFVKQRWRNLRDQFNKEFKKVNIPPNNSNKPYMKSYRGKWVHFEAMLFLKGSVISLDKSIRDTDNISDSETQGEDNSLDCDVNEEYSDGNEEKESSGSVENIIFEIKEEVFDPGYQDSNTYLPNQVLQKRQIQEIPNDLKQVIPEKKSKKSTKSTSDDVGNDDDDDDLYFLKSLVPYFKKLNPIRKLIVRNEIQNVLLRESLCDNCKMGGQSSCHK